MGLTNFMQFSEWCMVMRREDGEFHKLPHEKKREMHRAYIKRVAKAEGHQSTE